MSYKFDNNASSATIFQLWPIPVYKSNIPVRKETLEYCEKLEYYKMNTIKVILLLTIEY